MKIDNLWVLCSRTLIWHRVILGRPPESGKSDPPMASLACGDPEVVGSWFLREVGKDLPPMGCICECCEATWEIDLANEILE